MITATKVTTLTAASGAAGRTKVQASEDRAAVLAAWFGFLFGTAISVGGNVLATWLPRLTGEITDPSWTPGIWPQIGAAVWPLALLLSVEVLTRTNWRAGLQWTVARLGGILAVALGGAVISYGHLHEVLTAWKYPQAAAFVGPLVIDGLMLISGFALLSISKNRAQDNDAQSVGERPESADRISEPLPTGNSQDREAAPTTSQRRRGSKPKRRKVTAGGSESRDKARAHWDVERAAGRDVTGADLARVGGVDASMGRRWRREFEAEDAEAPQTGAQPTADPIADQQQSSAATGDDQGRDDGEALSEGRAA